jgi:hypothetical protein
VKNSNSGCKYDDIEGNYSITQYANLTKKQEDDNYKIELRQQTQRCILFVRSFYRVPYIEDKLWFRNATALFHSVSSLQDQTFYLTSKCGILSGEPLFKCELSDMLDIIKPDEVPYAQDDHILIMKICQGKTSQNKAICGVVVGNGDVKIYPIKSIICYLFRSFDITQK